MGEFRELLNEDERLVILRALEKELGYSHNESILHSVLERFGHQLSRDKVRTHLSWLEEQGLVTLEKPCGVYVATITERGADVATGRTVVPGVRRPNPGK